MNRKYASWKIKTRERTEDVYWTTIKCGNPNVTYSFRSCKKASTVRITALCPFFIRVAVCSTDAARRPRWSVVGDSEAANVVILESYSCSCRCSNNWSQTLSMQGINSCSALGWDQFEVTIDMHGSQTALWSPSCHLVCTTPLLPFDALFLSSYAPSTGPSRSHLLITLHPTDDESLSSRHDGRFGRMKDVPPRLGNKFCRALILSMLHMDLPSSWLTATLDCVSCSQIMPFRHSICPLKSSA